MIFSDHSFLINSVSSLKSYLIILNDLLFHLSLNISPSKSKFCVFKKQTNIFRSKIPSIKLNDVVISFCKSIRFLGIHISSSLGWDEHINHLIQTCNNPINIIVAISHRYLDQYRSILYAQQYRLLTLSSAIESLRSA